MAERWRCAAPWLGKRGKEGLTGEVRARRRRAPVGVDAGSRGRWLRRGNRATRRSQVATARGDAAAWPAAEARWLGLGSTGSAVEGWLRQLEGWRGGERWLVGETTTRRRRRAAFREARHQNLGNGKGTEGAAWATLELDLGTDDWRENGGTAAVDRVPF
jgi:hypothetical protein